MNQPTSAAADQPPNHRSRSRRMQRWRIIAWRGRFTLQRIVKRMTRRAGATPGATQRNNAIVEAGARQLGYQVTRLPGDYLQLRHGEQLAYSRSSDFEFENLIAWHLCGDKEITHRLLSAARLPVPRHLCVDYRQADLALAFLYQASGPIVVKPARGTSGGTGVTLSVDTPARLFRALGRARSCSAGPVLLEDQLAGTNYRLTVLDGEVVSVVERMPAHVTGDGRSTVAALIELENRAREDSVAPALPVDRETREQLRRHGLSLDSIPESGAVVLLRDVCNADQGGSVRDCSSRTHAAYLELAVRATATMRARLAGVDIITTDIGRPPAQAGAIINEVNTTPALYIVDAPGHTRSESIGQILAGRMMRQP